VAVATGASPLRCPCWFYTTPRLGDTPIFGGRVTCRSNHQAPAARPQTVQLTKLSSLGNLCRSLIVPIIIWAMLRSSYACFSGKVFAASRSSFGKIVAPFFFLVLVAHARDPLRPVDQPGLHKAAADRCCRKKIFGGSLSNIDSK
jgi:hypothetical protein